MTKIVSGLGPQEVFSAWLAGSEQGLGLAKEQQDRRFQAEQNEKDRQTKLQTEMMEALTRHKNEQAKTRELLNQQAQMGDAQALQELALQAQADENPDLSMLGDIHGMLGGIQDPKARAQAIPAVEDLLKRREAIKEEEAFGVALERGTANALPGFDPEAYKNRAAAGEKHGALTKEISDLQSQATIDAMVAQQSMQDIQTAQGLIDAYPPGSYERKLAETELQGLVGSPYDQAKPGASARMLEAVKRHLLGSSTEYGKRMKAEADARRAKMKTSGGLASEKYGVKTFSGGTTQPRTPAMQEHIKSQKAEKTRRAETAPGTNPIRYGFRPKPDIDVKQLTESVMPTVKTDADLIQRLKEQGVKLTKRILDEAMKVGRDWRNDASKGGDYNL